MKIFFLIIVLGIVVESCKKTQASRLMVKIENSTNDTLDSVMLFYDTTHYNYGTILPGNSTEYHSFKSLPNDPAIRGKLRNNSFIAGPIIPPNSYHFPILSIGKYTLKVFPDTAFVYGYNAKFLSL